MLHCEAARQSQVALFGHTHCEVAATFKVHVIIAVLAQVAMEAGGIADRNAQCEVDGARHDDFLLLGNCIGEVHKLHQVAQTVLHSQGRVLQDVRHVRAVEHIKAAAHNHLVEVAAHLSLEVGIHLSIYQRLLRTLGIDEFEVAGLHVEIHADVAQVGHV